MSYFRSALVTTATAVALAACSVAPAHAETLTTEIVKTYDFPAAFIQGLEVDGDQLLVGTGEYGNSKIYRLDSQGSFHDVHRLEPRLFGEGVTRTGNVVWQLTWLENTAIKRDATTLEELQRVHYDGEGWGLCATGTDLIMSDGSNQLRRLDPDTFEEKERISVTRDGVPVRGLNELECVGDDVYANVFQTRNIVRINPSGEVTATIKATVPDTGPKTHNAVLNGIAHIPGTDRFLITGKNWRNLYEVRFVTK